jgi:IS6 family transposase
MRATKPIAFKWRPCHGDVILQGVRRYCKYSMSYRDLEEMMEERGFALDSTTVYRGVQQYVPALKERLNWHKKRDARRWHLDETYIKIKGEWTYLYQAVDERGNTLDFYLSHRRHAIAAKRFLKRLIKGNPTCDMSVISTNKNPAYGHAIRELKQEGTLDNQVQLLPINYRNNRLKADHGKFKRLINPAPGFQSMKTAYATIKGFEIMRLFKKGLFNIWIYGTRTEISFINEQFRLSR